MNFFSIPVCRPSRPCGRLRCSPRCSSCWGADPDRQPNPGRTESRRFLQQCLRDWKRHPGPATGNPETDWPGNICSGCPGLRSLARARWKLYPVLLRCRWKRIPTPGKRYPDPTPDSGSHPEESWLQRGSPFGDGWTELRINVDTCIETCELTRCKCL